MRFRLQGTLQPGDEAPAKLLQYDPGGDIFLEPAAAQSDIVVHATFHRAFGVVGEEGWAQLWADTRRWEVISMENCLVRPGIANDAIAAGGSGGVTVDGVTITAENWSADIDVESGDKLLVFYSPPSQQWYFVKSGEPGEEGGGGRVWHATAIDDIAPGATGTVELSSGAEVEATNWSDDIDIDAEDNIHVYRDAFDDNYYAIKGGAGSELIRFELTADLRWGEDPIAPNALKLEFVGGGYTTTTFKRDCFGADREAG